MVIGRPSSTTTQSPPGRPDKRGINVFETIKAPGADFTGFKLDIGAAFASQVQNLGHRNGAQPNVVNGVNANQLADIGFGFNTSTANLALNAQLAPGVRVALTSYLSSRHHNETWVKDGFIQIDESPIDIAPLKKLFEFTTVRVGHTEINYGDTHFRRSDNGNAMYHSFVGNYIMDAFTTEIGGEVYVKHAGFLAMGAVTGGEIRGTVLTPGQRGPTYIGKLGVDRQVRKDLRLRLTGSVYTTDKALSSTLYGGDRAGSRYYYVLENTTATDAAQKDSGLINPGFKNRVTAMRVNPFVKYRGLELFGVFERAEGKATAEATERVWNQQAVDVVYRFLADEKVFVGARYNKAHGNAGRHQRRPRRHPLAGQRRLVHHAAPSGQSRVRQPEILRLSAGQYQARRTVRRLHARRRRRFLGTGRRCPDRPRAPQTRPAGAIAPAGCLPSSSPAAVAGGGAGTVAADEPSPVVVARVDGVYRVSAAFAVTQSVAVVTATLTDYAGIPRFMPEVRGPVR